MTPPPGSDEANALGCTCPTLDNNHGRGAYEDSNGPLYWINADCPLHGQTLEATTQVTGRGQ